METRAAMTLTPSGGAASASVFDSDGGAIGKARKVADRDSRAGREAGEHDLASGAAFTEAHRALFDVAVGHDEHDARVAVALDGAFRHEHRALRECGAAGRSCGVAVRVGQ